MERMRDRYLLLAKEFTECLAEELGSTLKASVGFGGLARANGIFEEWSDIDILVILSKSHAHHLIKAGEVRRIVFENVGVNSTIAVLTEREVASRFVIVSPANSVILNALSGRPETGILLKGDIEFLLPEAQLEAENAASYILDTMVRFRRFISAGEWGEIVEANSVVRVVKWTASIMRAALRLERVFVLPYEPSIEPLKNIYKEVDWGTIEQIFTWRFAWGKYSKLIGCEIFSCLLDFIEQFYGAVAKRHKLWIGIAIEEG